MTTDESYGLIYNLVTSSTAALIYNKAAEHLFCEGVISVVGVKDPMVAMRDLSIARPNELYFVMGSTGISEGFFHNGNYFPTSWGVD
jgi:hypothetical protein